MILSSKSDKPDFYSKIMKQLDYLLSEQRAQRNDLATLTRMTNSLINSTKLQKQVDEFYDDDVTSPQTDSVEQN